MGDKQKRWEQSEALEGTQLTADCSELICNNFIYNKKCIYKMSVTFTTSENFS